MIFGIVKFEITGDNYSKFYKQMLEKKLPCNNIQEIKGILTFDVSVEYVGDIEQLCEQLDLEYKTAGRSGLFLKLLSIFKHKGIIIGAAVTAVICIVLSNFVFRFNILCDDTETKKAIMAVLKENGVQAGSYIPNLNLVNLERELKQKVDEISWAGISVSGSTLTIDTVKNIPQPESRNFRMPCNLIAKYDAIIDKVELYDGQLMTTIGSAVTKGDVIVSGAVVNENVTYKDGKEIKDSNTKYVRSLANVYGTFEQNVTISQAFKEKKKVISDDTIKKRYLKVFDVQLPLFFSTPKGNYESASDYKGLYFFGYNIPIGINTVSLNEYSFIESEYTESEAKELAEEKLKKYEKNFFADYEIKDVKTNENTTDDGVEINAVYTLYGEITKEAEFFISK